MIILATFGRTDLEEIKKRNYWLFLLILPPSVDLMGIVALFREALGDARPGVRRRVLQAVA